MTSTDTGNIDRRKEREGGLVLFDIQINDESILLIEYVPCLVSNLVIDIEDVKIPITEIVSYRA